MDEAMKALEAKRDAYRREADAIDEVLQAARQRITQDPKPAPVPRPAPEPTKVFDLPPSVLKPRPPASMGWPLPATLKPADKQCTDHAHAARSPRFIDDRQYTAGVRLYGQPLCDEHLASRRQKA